MPEAVQGGRVVIREHEKLHHLLRVARVKVGEPLQCFDGTGRVVTGSVVQSGPRELIVEVREEAMVSTPRVVVTLVQALIHPSRFEWVLQKATELGVAEIIPMMTARTVVRQSDVGVSSGRLTRWRRMVEEAAEQSGRATLPVLRDPQQFEGAVSAVRRCHALLLTLVGPAAPFADSLKDTQGQTAVAVLIGPEGDFTNEEVARANCAGIHATRLAGTTLRSETAAIATLAVVQHALGAL